MNNMMKRINDKKLLYHNISENKTLLTLFQLHFNNI